MRHPFANEDHCRIYDQICHWSEDCHCFNQEFCLLREEKIPKEKLRKYKEETEGLIHDLEGHT